MNLDDAQMKKVSEWIAQGLKLSEIQTRLAGELGAKLTYMEVRLLVDDLKLTPKDPEPPKQAAPSPLTSPAAPQAPAEKQTAAPATAPGGVSVVVDEIAKPGATVSGKVTFTDGNSADWYFDQTGRLGLVPQKEGYRPPQADLQQFQAALEAELSKLGF